MPEFATPNTVEGPAPELPALSHLRHTSADVSIRQHTSAYVSRGSRPGTARSLAPTGVCGLTLLVYEAFSY
jgi:hypothetical protein